MNLARQQTAGLFAALGLVLIVGMFWAAYAPLTATGLGSDA